MTDKAFRGEGVRLKPAARGPRRAGQWAASAALALLTGLVAGDAPARKLAYPAWAQRVVVDAALKSAVPPELALAVARAGRNLRLAGAGAPEAVGIMQVLPSVARAELGIRAYGLGDARANAGIGVALLERLHRRYGERWDLALSHYRGGPLARCASGPVAHAQTVDYVAAVMEWWRRYQKDGTVAALTGGAATDATRAPQRARAANSKTPGAPGSAGQPTPGDTRAWGSENGPASPDRDGRFRFDDRPAHGHGRPPRFF